MLTAVWVAVIAAAAAFVIGVGVAVYVMLKAARLMTESSAAIASLREREDLLIERASTAIDRVGEQIARTETITATMDDVTAGLAELRGQMTELAPAAQPSSGDTGAAAWTAALVYGVARALGLRLAAPFLPRPRPSAQRLPRPGPAQRLPQVHDPAQDRLIRRRGAGGQLTPGPGRPTAVTQRRRPALTGRRGGAAP
jgi:hypothetical protein